MTCAGGERDGGFVLGCCLVDFVAEFGGEVEEEGGLGGGGRGFLAGHVLRVGEGLECGEELETRIEEEEGGGVLRV